MRKTAKKSTEKLAAYGSTSLNVRYPNRLLAEIDALVARRGAEGIGFRSRPYGRTAAILEALGAGVVQLANEDAAAGAGGRGTR